jgi:hypothetical protein
MRSHLLILALLLSHIGCAQPMSTRRFSVDERPPAAQAQRNGRTNEVSRGRAESGPRAVQPEEPGTSSPAPREGDTSTVPTGTAGRRAVEAVTEGSGTTATGGSGEAKSKDADTPFSYSVSVAQPGSNRGRLVAAIALGAAVVAVALWAVRRRLGA